MTRLKCFKAYDIRGKVPEELNPELVYKIARSFAAKTQAKKIIVGYDIRLESPMLFDALVRGLNSMGVSVINIALCGTEEVYFHTFHKQSQGVDGGIMITASHNPMGYNGLKMVTKGSYPLSWEDGLKEIHDHVLASTDTYSQHMPPFFTNQHDKNDYINHLLSYIDIRHLKPLKIVVNPGHGTAGLILQELSKYLPIDIIMIHAEPNGTFPMGVPNPMLVDQQHITAQAVRAHNANLGIAWDGDFDRCFFFDENGTFIEGYYIVGLLAEAFLKKNPKSNIVHDPKLFWNTQDIVQKHGGQAIQSKTGHSIIKKMMRMHDAVYGGEISAHHYFRDFHYCDSGMIPWLLMIELLSNRNQPLSTCVQQQIIAYPCSGERNYHIHNTEAVLKKIYTFYAPQSPEIDQADGLSMSFSDWRFNIRASNTEPLMRLNIETKGNRDLLEEKLLELESLLCK